MPDMSFLTIVDDYTKAIWIFMMHLKGQTVDVLSNFLRMVENQLFGVTAKVIRTDNGYEFFSHE